MWEIIKQMRKSSQNRWKSRLGLVPGALGGGLGSQFGSQGRLGQPKGARWPKCVLKWVPIWGVIFNIFRYFWYIFEHCFRDSVLVATMTDFWWILVGFFDYFLKLFCILSGSLTSEENVILIQYLLCFKHIGLLRNKRKIIDFSYIFRYFFRDGYRHNFSSILVGFWLHFGRLFGAKIAKSGNKNSIEKHDCKKVVQDMPQPPPVLP